MLAFILSSILYEHNKATVLFLWFDRYTCVQVLSAYHSNIFYVNHITILSAFHSITLNIQLFFIMLPNLTWGYTYRYKEYLCVKIYTKLKESVCEWGWGVWLLHINTSSSLRTRSFYLYSFTWDPGLWMLTYSLLVLGDNTSLCILGERRKFKKYDRGKIGQSYNVCIKKGNWN